MSKENKGPQGQEEALDALSNFVQKQGEKSPSVENQAYVDDITEAVGEMFEAAGVFKEKIEQAKQQGKDRQNREN